MIRNLRAFRNLYQQHAEDMVILAYTLLADSEKANMAVEYTLMKIWDEGDFDSIDTAKISTMVKEECHEIQLSRLMESY